ncbi:MAG: hypothetical protein CSA81_10455 [Acidobacteria bacterium]|nr:MAG: hypothetical protein CSA81_10455 [Acidobacteriota bacterium]
MSIRKCRYNGRRIAFKSFLACRTHFSILLEIVLKPRVKILYTGGTLGMSSSKSGELVPGEALADLSRWVPELAKLVDIDVDIIANMDSSLIQPELWLDLAEHVKDAQNDEKTDGIVILHGTDTLAFTASMLSFLIPDLQIPVVLTGSQKPLQIVRTDARNNIIGAVETCIEGPVEVLVFFRDNAFRGNRCTKSAISHFRAFESPNFPPLGKAGIRWKWRKQDFWPKTRRPSIWPDLPKSFPETPWVLPWTPGFNLSGLESGLRKQWAVIIEAFGAGNIPLIAKDKKVLKDYLNSGGLIALRSQVPKGEIEMGLYAPGKELMELGVINAGDMTREALLTKMMAMKALNFKGSELKHAIARTLVGEVTEAAD